MHVLIAVMMWSNLVSAPVPAARLHMQAPDGKAVFQANCIKCHGPKGVPAASTKRNMPEIPTFDAKFLSKKTVANVVQVVTKGKGDMKPVSTLSAAELNAVAQYIFELANTTPKAGK